MSKPIRLSDYFSDVADTRPFNIVHIRQRLPHQRLGSDNKEIDNKEIDVLVTATCAETGDDLIVMVEVRDRQRATGIDPVTKLHANAIDYGKQHGVTVLPAYLSRSSFTKKAEAYCKEHGIGMAEEVASV
ncbi:MAG: hypothetical protein AAF639_47380 [Chloroflexota bacterium]